MSPSGTNPRQTGLTLIEIMLAVAVVAILAGIAYPSYTKFITKSKRTDAKAVLFEAAQYLEGYRAVNNSYPVTTATYTAALDAGDRLSGYYVFSASTPLSADTYVIRAEPTGTDAECGRLELTHAGERRFTGTGSLTTCW